MFSQVLGHHRLKKQFQQDVESSQLHQSYLLSGPEHVGKMTLLLEILSQVRTGSSFDKDSVFSKQVLAGQGPGVLCFWDDGNSLKVEQVRGIVDFVSKRTAEGETSFCVIEHIERMTLSAANAFLKVLEEPSERMVFLMTTKEEHKLLATIRSRVQLYRCADVPQKEVEEFLAEKVKNPVEREELIKLSAGRVGLAVQLFEDEELLKRYKELYDYAMIVLDDDIAERFQLADHLTKKEVSKVELQQFLVFLAQKLQQEGTSTFSGQLERLQELRQWFADTQVNKRLQLEELFLSF